MKWGQVIVLYFLMLLSTQAGIYLLVPKYSGPVCTFRTFPETATRRFSASDYIYGYQSNIGFQIATLDDFEASYFNLNPTLGPIVVAHFVLEDRWNVFNKYSLLSVGDRTRRLYFDARFGSLGEYKEVCCDDLDSLKEQVAVTLKNTKYLQPRGYSFPIPIVDTPMILLKIFIHFGLVYVSTKVSQKYGHLITLQSLIKSRRAAGLCVHCTYDCKDLPSPTCPECGQPHTIPIESPIIESNA